MRSLCHQHVVLAIAVADGMAAVAIAFEVELVSPRNRSESRLTRQACGNPCAQPTPVERSNPPSAAFRAMTDQNETG
jgi:hypothetical protein